MMKSKTTLNCTTEYFAEYKAGSPKAGSPKAGESRKPAAILATWAAAALATLGLMWASLWLLTGSLKPDFSLNIAGLLNRISEARALKTLAIYRPFEDDGQISWLFILGVFLVFAILVMVLAWFISLQQHRGKAMAERFWCWLACLIVVVLLVGIGSSGIGSSGGAGSVDIDGGHGSSSLAANVEKQVKSWHESIENKLAYWKYGAEGDPMTLGDFTVLDGLETGEPEPDRSEAEGRKTGEPEADEPEADEPKADSPGTDEEALQVTMSSPQCCYLKGYVGEIYEADGWKPLAGKELTEENGLFVELYDGGFYNQTILGKAVSLTKQGAVGGYGAGSGDDAVGDSGADASTGTDADASANQITIKNTGTDSRYMYVPYEMISVEAETEKLIGGAVLKAEKNKANLEYTLTAADYAEDKISETKALLKDLENDDFFIKEYNYRQFAGRKYLQMTDEARRALTEFLGEDTDRLTTAQVKKKILQSFENFKYEKNTAYRAEQGDFLTVFLEGAEGYSVHFATAATLMFRYYGIPARFAEGYLVTPEDAKNVAGGEPISVGKTNYHAWAEYYEDGVGWIPFEATPAYMGVMPGDVSVVWESESGGNQQQRQPENKPADNKVNNLITEEAEVNLWAAAKVALLILLICALIGTAVWRLTHRRFGGFSKKDFKSKDCRRAIMAMMAYMRKLDSRSAVISGDAAVIANGSSVISGDAEKLYEEARYSNHPMTEAQKELMSQYMSQAIKAKKEAKSLRKGKKVYKKGRESY